VFRSFIPKELLPREIKVFWDESKEEETPFWIG